MSQMRVICLFLVCVCVTTGGVSSGAGPLDRLYNLWDSVVSRHVQGGAMEGIPLHIVDYEAISKDGNYTAFIEGVAKVNLSGLDNNNTYAFFMNVYNALAIKMIIDHPCVHPTTGSCHPIKSIRDIGSLLHPVWGLPAGTVGGKMWTLDQVEGFLRHPPHPLKEDSRLHACIVCASISCPNVRMEAYRREQVGEQMDSQVKDFLSNSKKGLSLDRSANTLTLSPIFLWFAGDFKSYGGVKQFTSHYLTPSDADYIAKNNPELHYFSYDWNLNGVPPCTC
ncbi:uncharacterized protein LOC135344343 [Halichondria panicea]|uniref:uncharacterized protein LOC135344343 n=1 Tax=Halichondria panicea TaxID=6063 RepID=UPI00312B60B2